MSLKGKTKFIVWGLVLIAIIAFFLPLMKASFDFMGQTDSSSISVMGMSTKFDVFGTPAKGNAFWFIMLILPLAALGFSFIPNSKTRAILYIVVAILVAGLAIAEYIVTKSKVTSALGDIVSIKIGISLILYILFGLGLICTAVLDLKEKE
jgi:hypothetical protein